VTSSDPWILIGRIRGAHGVRGELSVEPLTDFPHRFQQLETVHLGDAHREYAVVSARTRSRIFLTLQGVTDREQARGLSGVEIWIPREQAISLPTGEFYADEIIGLIVETTDGETLGPITDLIATGANDVYVVQASGREVLIPAIKDVVKQIDVAGKRVIVELVEGLLD